MRAGFEIEDSRFSNENRGQPTSVDLAISGEGFLPVFVEAKFVEREYGGCSVLANGDCDGSNPLGDFGRCYLHHIGRTYWSLMARHEVLSDMWRSSPV